MQYRDVCLPSAEHEIAGTPDALGLRPGDHAAQLTHRSGDRATCQGRSEHTDFSALASVSRPEARASTPTGLDVSSNPILQGAATLPRVGSPSGEIASSNSLTSAGVLRVAVLCRTALFGESLEGLIRAAPGLRLWQPDASGGPDVALCAGPSGPVLRSLRQALPLDPWPRAVLLDTAGQLGPVGAALHGFLGYLPPEVTAERLLRCLRRVAGGQPDAPRPYLAALIFALQEPPLEPSDQEILCLLAAGHTHAEINQELCVSERTLQRHITHLLEAFDANAGHHLAAMAVALGLGWPWVDEPESGPRLR